MKLHELGPKSGACKPRKRLGRGRSSGTGKTSGRGHKGAKSRAGYSRKPGFEGGQMPLVRRVPKRGFSNYLFKKAWVEVNLTQLADKFEAGATVDPDSLAKARVVKGNFHGIVVLGNGELEGPLTVKAHRFSKSAAAKIVAAGGTVEVLSVKPEAAAANTKVTAAKAEVVEAKAEVVEAQVEVAEAEAEVADDVAEDTDGDGDVADDEAEVTE